MASHVIDHIKKCLLSKQDFLLSGGAGSGKTYTLIQTLKTVLEINATSQVACITYTNVAADEIKERSPFSNLHVSTIHDFLWDVIKGYQKNLKQAIIALINAEKSSNGTGLSNSGEDEITIESLEIIEYKNFRNIEKGIISHDDLLRIANYMFYTYPLLSKVLCDKYEFIFIDEYQDTQSFVIDIFLKHIKSYSTNPICIGFFGDRMQSIYDTGVGNIQEFVESGQVKEIIIEDNFRCSVSVINFLNKVRFDIYQKPSKKDIDGKICNKKGSISFVYSQNDFDLEKFKNTKFVTNWDFTNSKQTKVLLLTHKLIAKRLGFEDLIEAYRYTDRLIGKDTDVLASHILKIGSILSSFQKGEYSRVISEIHFKIGSISDKEIVSKFLSKMLSNMDNSIDNIITCFDCEKILCKDNLFDEYIAKYSETYEAVKLLPLSQVIAYFNYYNNFSPYSTQHGIKGTEYDNVLVVMDNGKWNNYNFKYYFERTTGKETIINRTEQIFYVCCSRTIENLVVYYPMPTYQILEKARLLFGDSNVHQI